MFLFLVGCNTAEIITYELDLSQLSEEIYIDEFDVKNIRIKTISNIKGESFIAADESMFTAKDYSLFFAEGTHSITIKYRLFEETFTISLKKKKTETPVTSKFESTNSYYSKANGLNGEQLKLSLREIISIVTKEETYGDLRYDIPKTDTDPNNPNNIILLYTGKSVSSKWDGGSTWNREHVWPRSLGWFSEEGAGGDLHHIRPTNPSENSARGNKKYGVSSGFYEPRDEVKGDIARIIFYLMVRYKEADNYTFKSVAESKEMLFEWHKLDPVDNFEKNRNEETYKIQGNRNPFIDHPECADLIWNIVEVYNNEINYYMYNVVYYLEKQNYYKCI